MSLENFIITVYCLVAESMENLMQGKKLRQRGFLPKLTDAEVITMEIVGNIQVKKKERAVKNHELTQIKGNPITRSQ